MASAFNNRFGDGFGAGEQMHELLVMANDSPTLATYPNSAYRKGDVVAIFPEGHSWGNAEGPPSFVIIKQRLSQGEVARFLQAIQNGQSVMTSRREIGLAFPSLSQNQQDQLAAGQKVEPGIVSFAGIKTPRA